MKVRFLMFLLIASLSVLACPCSTNASIFNDIKESITAKIEAGRQPDESLELKQKAQKLLEKAKKLAKKGGKKAKKKAKKLKKKAKKLLKQASKSISDYRKQSEEEVMDWVQRQTNQK